MTAQRPGTIYKLDTITNSAVDSSTNSITYKLGGATDGSVYTTDAEAWNGLGIASLPANPTSQGGAESVSIERSDYNMVIGSRDLRYQTSQQDIKPGEIYIFAVGANGSNTSTIKLKDGESIIISNNGNVTITSPLTTVSNGGTAQFVALSNLVKAELDKIVATLATGSNSGGPVLFGTPYVASAVAATTLKAQ